jgi:hypothetical protein
MSCGSIRNGCRASIVGEKRQGLAMNADEAVRRQSNTTVLMAHFMAHPLKWIGWRDIAKVCESPASWRTRVSDCRKIAKRDGGDIEWNRNCRESAYRFKPFVPIARDSTRPTPALPLFDDGPWSR